MNKLIIRNETNLSDEKAIKCVLDVIHLGRLSETYLGEQYCFLTRRWDMEIGIEIIVKKRRSGTETFYVREIKE